MRLLSKYAGVQRVFCEGLSQTARIRGEDLGTLRLGASAERAGDVVRRGVLEAGEGAGGKGATARRLRAASDTRQEEPELAAPYLPGQILPQGFQGGRAGLLPVCILQERN